VRRLTGIPVSVGIAETKVLAKLANYHAKRSARARGVLDLTRSKHQDTALGRTPVAEVWGIGPQYAAWLERQGISNALQLRGADDEKIRARMTIAGLRIVHELRGISCLPLELEPPPERVTTVSRTLGEYVTELNELRAAVA